MIFLKWHITSYGNCWRGRSSFFGAPTFLVFLWSRISWRRRYFLQNTTINHCGVAWAQGCQCRLQLRFLECPFLLLEDMLFLFKCPLFSPDKAIRKMSMPVLPVLREGWLSFWLRSATINLCDGGIALRCHLWFISRLRDDLFYVDAFAMGKVGLFNGASLAASNDGTTINLFDADRSSDGRVCHNAVSGDSYRKEPKQQT